MFSSFSTYYHLIQRAWVCLCWVSVEGESMTTTAQKGQKRKNCVWLRLIFSKQNISTPKNIIFSVLLGPTEEQEHLLHCVMQGECKEPLGTRWGNFVVVMLMVLVAVVVVLMMMMLLICCSTVGLIYVNPGGPADNPGVPAASAKNIRSVGFSSWNTLILLICKKQEHLWSHEYERFRDGCSHWWVRIDCPWI